MRTRVTLDEDVMAALRAAAREREQPFEDVLDAAVRRGLSTTAAPRPYRLGPHALGLRPDVDLDRTLRLAAQLEDEEKRRELERGA